MRPDSLAYIIQSIARPGGLMEIYKALEIGDLPGCRIPLLDTCRDFRELQRHKESGDYEYATLQHGLAFKYEIHNGEWSSGNIHLQLWLTKCRAEFPMVFSGDGRAHAFYYVKMLRELQNFMYAPEEIQRVGESIKAGQITGPLENAVLQEALEKDRNAGERRQKIGGYLLALGEFAGELLQRNLSID